MVGVVGVVGTVGVVGAVGAAGEQDASTSDNTIKQLTANQMIFFLMLPLIFQVNRTSVY